MNFPSKSNFFEPWWGHQIIRKNSKSRTAHPGSWPNVHNTFASSQLVILRSGNPFPRKTTKNKQKPYKGVWFFWTWVKAPIETKTIWNPAKQFPEIQEYVNVMKNNSSVTQHHMKPFPMENNGKQTQIIERQWLSNQIKHFQGFWVSVTISQTEFIEKETFAFDHHILQKSVPTDAIGKILLLMKAPGDLTFGTQKSNGLLEFVTKFAQRPA